MGKGLETFLIMSQFWYQDSSYTGLFLTFPAEHSTHIFLITFHERRILLIWHLNILSYPKWEVKDIFLFYFILFIYLFILRRVFRLTHLGGHAQNSPWNIYAMLRFQEIGLLIESMVIDQISVSFPLSQGTETTNLYHPHWLLSIQYWVLAIPLVYGYRIVFWKSSPDLWKRVNLKSFRSPGPRNRKRIKHE